MFETYSSAPSPTGVHFGSPSLTTISVGSVATTTTGGLLGTGSSASGFGSIWTRSAGGLVMGAQGPSGSFAEYQRLPLLR